jgi:hypothetical protein
VYKDILLFISEEMDKWWFQMGCLSKFTPDDYSLVSVAPKAAN